MEETKKRILFVDDEPRVLEGLQRTLRSMRQEWEMHFAGSGPEALEYLSKEPTELLFKEPPRGRNREGRRIFAETEIRI